ncbi:hypothetical protein [Sinorhizobium sp. GL28]|uniref:hypothetical protein n=1 Tax=Sinorhizobium sp. GL28 TaxID=1358418 RepID=UPI00071E04BA|nr:hypothetical protein [Sinorhizobium sp. GL28]KSV89775.1 hypothetical protein N184_27160 [Sinorhizobium sp. GL28]
MAEPTSRFQPKTLDFIARNPRAADRIARILGTTPEAILGAVANEFDTRQNPELNWKSIGWAHQAAADFLAGFSDHDDLARNYDELSRFGPPEPPGAFDSIVSAIDSFGEELPFVGGVVKDLNDGAARIKRKLRNPALVDVGPGNIQLKTAMDLLKQYETENPDGDPLNLKKYSGDLGMLRGDLLNFEDPQTTLAMAGLMTRNADGFFVGQDEAAWRRLPKDKQDAMRVMYYKMGPATLARNIARSKGQAAAANRVFDFNPYGDGGEQHLNNLNGIKNAIHVGRIQGENTAPHVPEDELVKAPSRVGPAVPPSGWPGPRRVNPQFTYDGRAAVSGMRGELDPYQGFDTPKERLALEREARQPSLESLHDKREAQQMSPTRWASSPATPPVSDLERFWQNKVPDLDDIFNAVRTWLD